MKKAPLILLCFLFVGLTPPEEELTVRLTTNATFSGISVHRLQGDQLVATFKGDTMVIPIDDISEISSRSLVMGFSGCWFGSGVGALLGASCGAAVEPIESPNGGEMERGAQMAFGALLGCGLGSIGGCAFFPENEQRYQLGDMAREQKKSALALILSRHGTPVK